MKPKPAPDPAVEPVYLLPVTIDKPWGRELWYTGIEARGESAVRLGERELPLSDYLALDPAGICGGHSIVLLKVLDPDPSARRGRLYFEVHERKHEVYVVTRVDPDAWPDGVGAIRFGMNQELRRRYADDDRFRADYIRAVQDYERIRRALDDGATVSPAVEAERLAAMYRFTAMQPLRVGDVVHVPPWAPHALQHGVQVVELQTPTYERYILSFEQRVVTQNHWDTAFAAARMSLDPPAPPLQQPNEAGPGVEIIARFEDFNAWRITLARQEEVMLPAHAPYCVCFCISGAARFGSKRLGRGESLLVPGGALPGKLEGLSKEPAVIVAAAPGL